ncbi:MAG: hypothetical protein ABUT20_44280, partial [Bacteroidota bacterium]
MRNLFFSCCILLFLSPVLAEHPTYLKYLQAVDNSSRIRVLPTQDRGWYLFSLDSLKIYKFNNCGHLQWAFKYSFPLLPWRGVDIVATQTGGFAFLIMNYPSSNYHAFIVNADAQGNVLWCKSFEDVPYTEVPYTLIQDNAGNFFLYGNVTYVPNNDVFNSLTKISAGGTVVWRKLYNHGGTWGGAIRTKDKGFLLRTGNTFIKTDLNGNEIWTRSFLVGMYNYCKPVEVNDGYICNGYDHNAIGGDTITFFKMDKSGALQWGGKKVVDFIGVPQELCS